MVDAWPSGLPQKFEQDSFSEGVGDNLLETQPDQGPPISRRRSTAAVRPISGVMKCTAAQVAMFRSFFDATILSGAVPFSFPDQMQSGDLLVKFTKQNPPAWSASGWDTYDLRLTLQVLP